MTVGSVVWGRNTRGGNTNGERRNELRLGESGPCIIELVGWHGIPRPQY